MIRQGAAAARKFDYWIRRSAFFDGARRAGCFRYSFANHMYQPAGYDDQDSLEAYWYLVNGVMLCNVGTERQAGITGPDALAFTNSLTPRDLTTCRIGCCCYTLVTSEEGGRGRCSAIGLKRTPKSGQRTPAVIGIPMTFQRLLFRIGLHAIRN